AEERPAAERQGQQERGHPERDHDRGEHHGLRQRVGHGPLGRPAEQRRRPRGTARQQEKHVGAVPEQHEADDDPDEGPLHQHVEPRGEQHGDGHDEDEGGTGHGSSPSSAGISSRTSSSRLTPSVVRIVSTIPSTSRYTPTSKNRLVESLTSPRTGS